MLNPAKFRDPDFTAKGEERASVALHRLETLWLNTGTLCNITCANCYIDSSPTNDRLAYLRLAEVIPYLDEISALGWETPEIGLTGGEPFMNPDIIPILHEGLDRGFKVLVLTNAMKPMRRHEQAILALTAKAQGRLTLRVSLDAPDAARHDAERGEGSFAIALDGLSWAAKAGVPLAVAGRLAFGESEPQMRGAFQTLFDAHGIHIDAGDPSRLVLFPEMDLSKDVPEITTACWGILHKDPREVMCATSRMVVKRKGADRPAVLSCTLLPDDPAFELGATLAEAARPVRLNHPHCATFCVLGGASCSARG